MKATQSILHETSSSRNLNATNNASIVNDKYQEQEYSNYIDSSDVVIQTYKNSSALGLEKYFLNIEDWLERPLNSQQDNKPFILEAEEGVGKKTLLVKWMEYHQTKKTKRYPDIILSHFASAGGNNANYFFAIYRILNKLREALDIQQKVELMEEKLRKYFSYWLNHCSDKLEKQLKYGEKVYYDKVIIIIEGIDLFIDQQYNKEANVAFWLPKFFPEHIKLIVSCEKDSQANNYFKSIGCDMMKIPVDLNVVHTMVERHAHRPLFVNEEIRIKHLDILNSYDEKFKTQSFYKVFMCAFLPYPSEDIIQLDEIPHGTFEKMYQQLDYEGLKKIQDSSHLMEFILEFYSHQLMNKEKFIKLMRVFSLTQKGLTIEEVNNLTGITEEEWKLFLACFKVFVLGFKGLWIMNNEVMKRVVNAKYKLDHDQLRQQHQDIAQVLGKITPNSIRKLEEQTYHLFMSKDHFKLKEIISTIENFLLLFNPNNKYDLCRYWQILEEQGFDPVIEYNKAIEGFEMHYHPSSQDVFRIIVQISRFLKEFSDFETYFTPEFRHPPVKGTYEELDDIGLLRELLGLQIFQPTEAEENDKPDLDKFSKTPEEQIELKKEKMKLRNKKESTLKKKNKDDDMYGSIPTQTKPVLTKEERKEKRLKRFMILSNIEQLNVDIPSNREQFRNFYENEIKEIIKQNNQNHSDEQEGDENDDAASLSEEDEEESHQSRNGQPSFMEKEKNSQKKKKPQPDIITINQLRESYNLKERLPTNYYYKRWLWVQFPWACLSLKCDYSAKLKECFSSPIEYMSVKKEKEFTKQALKIAIEAKLKKQMMYKKSSMSDSQSIIKPIGGSDSIMIKTSASLSALPGINTNRKTKSLFNQNKGLAGGDGMDNTIINNNTISSGVYLGNKASSKAQNVQQSFYITDEFLNQSILNKELSQAVKQETLETQQSQNKGLPPAQSASINTSTYNAGQNTSKVLEKSKVFKEKSRFFDPITSIQDSQNLSTILPRLKGSIATHSTRELFLLEQQALEMKKELDNLIHTNRCLAKQYKALKVAEQNQLKYGINPERVENAQSKAQELETKIADTKENYLLSQMQIMRLKSILKICEDNKQQNEDWIRNLNYLLTNFRKMIRLEQEDIKTAKEECVQLQKINKDYVNVFQEKMDTQKILISQINTSIKSKEHFDSKFNKTDDLIEQSAVGQVEKMKQDQKGLDNRKKLREKQNQLEKNSKQIQEQLEKAEVQYNKLKEVIDISDSNYASSERFLQLLAAREKREDLTCIVLQRQDQISSLQAKFQARQSYLETVKKAYPTFSKEDSEEKLEIPQSEQQPAQPQDHVVQSATAVSEIGNTEGDILSRIEQLQTELEGKQRQYIKLQQMRLSASMTISTIQKKFNINQGTDIRSTIEFEEEPILARLEEKMEIIKQKSNPEDFAEFEEGKFDSSKVYRQLVANIGMPNYDEQDDDNASQRDI